MTSCRPSTDAGKTPLQEALAGLLTTKLLDKFADASKDPESRSMIAAEVRAFMASSGSVQEADLFILQDRIRSRLAGDEPQKNTLAAQKRAIQENDEWAKIYQMAIKMGKEQDAADRAKRAAKEEATRRVLAGQVAEHARQRELEAAADQAYHVAVEADLRAWEAAEAAKAAAKAAAMEQLKSDREAQLADRSMRKRLAEERRAAEEAELAARLAYEARAEFEKEEAQRIEAKAALKTFLLNNEVYKQIKEEAKKAVWAEDQAIMVAAGEQAEKQERARQAQLDKLKAWQAKQEREAAARPEAKRWIDESIINRYVSDKEAAAAADEARRQGAIKASNARLVASLAGQVAEREVARQRDRQLEAAAAAELAAAVAAEVARRRADKEKAAAKKLALRDMLVEQQKLSARCKVVAPMSDVEKQINAALLQKAAALGIRIGAAPVGTK